MLYNSSVTVSALIWKHDAQLTDFNSSCSYDDDQRNSIGLITLLNTIRDNCSCYLCTVKRESFFWTLLESLFNLHCQSSLFYHDNNFKLSQPFCYEISFVFYRFVSKTFVGKAGSVASKKNMPSLSKLH